MLLNRERGETYGYNIINDLNVWSQGFLQWNVILQDDGQGHYGPFEVILVAKNNNSKIIGKTKIAKLI